MKKLLLGLTLLTSISSFAGGVHSNCELTQEMRNKAISGINQVGFPDVYSGASLRMKAGALEACIKVEGNVQYLVTTWEVFGSETNETINTTEVFGQITKFLRPERVLRLSISPKNPGIPNIIYSGCLGDICLRDVVYPDNSELNARDGSVVLGIDIKNEYYLTGSKHNTSKTYWFAREELGLPLGCIQGICIGNKVAPFSWERNQGYLKFGIIKSINRYTNVIKVSNSVGVTEPFQPYEIRLLTAQSDYLRYEYMPLLNLDVSRIKSIRLVKDIYIEAKSQTTPIGGGCRLRHSKMSQPIVLPVGTTFELKNIYFKKEYRAIGLSITAKKLKNPKKIGDIWCPSSSPLKRKVGEIIRELNRYFKVVFKNN